MSLLQSFEKEPTTTDGFGHTHGFSKSFNGIFDTSNYGILQLNNGLARTPQMGSASLSLSLDFFFCFFVFFFFFQGGNYFL